MAACSLYPRVAIEFVEILAECVCGESAPLLGAKQWYIGRPDLQRSQVGGQFFSQPLAHEDRARVLSFGLFR